MARAPPLAPNQPARRSPGQDVHASAEGPMTAASQPGQQRTERAAYDDVADAYDRWVGTSLLDPSLDPALGSLIGTLTGSRVCALACGQGRDARYLADRGARVLGLDVSAQLLAIAGRAKSKSGVHIGYVRANASGVPALASAAFDGVLCITARSAAT
jgi:ubiquinone/menaquinone biosynthesis C-methylase UbiE